MDNMKDLRSELDELRAAQAAIQSRIDNLGNKLAKAEAEPDPKSPFARVEMGDKYFCIDVDGTVGSAIDYHSDWHDQCYTVANYCTDFDLLQQRAWHEELSRQLWRYSEEHGGDAEWNGTNEHWQIYETHGEFDVDWNDRFHHQGTVYFRSRETALSAIRDIVEPFLAAHPDFKW